MTHGFDHDAAVEMEKVVCVFCAGRLRWYLSVMQYVIATANTKQSANDTIKGYLTEANTPPYIDNGGERDALTTLDGMTYRCTEAGCTTNGRRCPKCQGTDIMSHGQQTRSADEGQTVFHQCNNERCKYKFK